MDKISETPECEPNAFLQFYLPHGSLIDVAVLQVKGHFLLTIISCKNAGRSIKRFCSENPGDSKTGHPFHELLNVHSLLGE